MNEIKEGWDPVENNTVEQKIEGQTDQRQLEFAKKEMIEEKKKEVREVLFTLGTLRAQKQGFKDAYDEAYMGFQNQNKNLLSIIDQNKKAIATTEDILRMAALEQYALTKDKQVGYGIVIKDKAKAEYDETEVKKWCMEKDMFLNVDITNFLRFAKAQKFKWIKFPTTDSATLPKKIDVEALKKE